ncbi:MAG: hypothetical protein KME21_03920 [Desmonostoc vinosum HA7617-LM4]|nr:hypothetical protein [Desmonostoc vinosum HA7617-LM4]
MGIGDWGLGIGDWGLGIGDCHLSLIILRVPASPRPRVSLIPASPRPRVSLIPRSLSEVEVHPPHLPLIIHQNLHPMRWAGNGIA